jgi:hypothetical protein
MNTKIHFPPYKSLNFEHISWKNHKNVKNFDKYHMPSMEFFAKELGFYVFKNRHKLLRDRRTSPTESKHLADKGVLRAMPSVAGVFWGGTGRTRRDGRAAGEAAEGNTRIRYEAMKLELTH